MISYNNCDHIFSELGLVLKETHFYASGYGFKTYTKGNITLTFYQDNLTKDAEFIIGKGEREIVYIGKLSSEEFLIELLKNIDYEYYI